MNTFDNHALGDFLRAASASRPGDVWLPGGAPSREVLERIARGLRLTTPEREHLFILAFGHPPQTRLTVTDDMTPRLQRVLDAFTIPAIIRSASWDVIARNTAAARVLTDYGQLPLAERNVLRRLFTGLRPAAPRRTGRRWGSLSLTPSAPTSRGWAPRKKLTS